MSGLLDQYEGRLREREIPSGRVSLRDIRMELSNLKFTPDGGIKPFFGFTCIAWIDSETRLFDELCIVQEATRAEFEQAGVARNFFFLDPASFHMTICDMSARSTSYTKGEADKICSQIQNVFSAGLDMEAVSARVRGIGLKTTITALVRFESEAELGKVLTLERQIKQAAGVDVRNFAGHITLAYCVNKPGDRYEDVLSILRIWREHDFGELTFSRFDLAYFTDMNTYIPLATIDLETDQVDTRPNSLEFLHP
jgi:hypothetical protein